MNILKEKNDYFKIKNEREIEEGYLYKITSFSEELCDFINKYFENLKKNGIYIKGNLKNPTKENIDYFLEIVGSKVKFDRNVLNENLKKWIPSFSDEIREKIVICLSEIFFDLTKEIKSVNILKNIYVKFMCWFFYQIQYLDIEGEILPKILYNGIPSKHELIFFKILVKLGIDILIFSLKDDVILEGIPNVFFKKESDFPENFDVEILMKYTFKFENIEKNERNIGEDIYKEILNNCERKSLFIKTLGVKDENTIALELLKFKEKIEKQGRDILILENQIEKPSFEEVEKIKRGNFNNFFDVIVELANNIKFSNKEKLKKIQDIFIKNLYEIKEEKHYKVINIGISIVCWLNRYSSLVIKNSKFGFPVLIYFGKCTEIAEKIFLKIISKLEIDVLLICPDKNQNYILEDEFLIEKIYEKSIDLKNFPKKIDDLEIKTVAFNAEKKLEEILYNDTGMYYQQQFKKATSVVLNTIFEEVQILWNQENKYRMNFETISSEVIIPNICTKVIGVPNRNISAYWKLVNSFLSENTFFYSEFPLEKENIKNNLIVSNYLINNTFLKKEIKKDPNFKYSFLNNKTQDYILEKIECVLNKNYFENICRNIKYKILEILLNLNIQILRAIQNYDFTKKSPKIVMVDIKETGPRIEDAILLAFFREIGFDILLFIPTGYQSVNKYLRDNFFVEHQVGEFVYDLTIPEYDSKNNKLNLGILNLKSFFKI